MNVDREDELRIQAPPGAERASENRYLLDRAGLTPEAQLEVGPGGWNQGAGALRLPPNVNSQVSTRQLGTTATAAPASGDHTTPAST